MEIIIAAIKVWLVWAFMPIVVLIIIFIFAFVVLAISEWVSPTKKRLRR